MKKLIVACFIIFGVASALSAQDTTSTQSSDQFRTDDTTSTQPTDQYRTDDTSQPSDDVNDAEAKETDTTSTATQPNDQYRSDDMNADQPSDNVSDADRDEDEDSEMISTVDLPPTVRAQLTSEDYSGWTVSKAHRKVKDGQTFYKVELTNGEDKKKVKFDAQGNVLKEKELGEKDLKEKEKDKY